jgi:hypothetical protein
VRSEQLDARCLAVCSPHRVEHDDSDRNPISADFDRFHATRYGAFSSLLRCTFDEALSCITDNSIDLLHIDGPSTYADVQHDFLHWEPKLSDRAIVLLHNTNVREINWGVWRFWAELQDRYPTFEFLHASGLGVLVHGRCAPGSVEALCQVSNPSVINAIRERCALLGGHWVADYERTTLERTLKDVTR